MFAKNKVSDIQVNTAVDTEVDTKDASNTEIKALSTAIDKSQAVISFKMDGTILKANDNFLNVVGYSLEEIQGKHHSMFVDPNYKSSNEYKEFWQRLNSGDANVAEFKRFGKGGKEVWIQASYIPVLDDNGMPSQVIKIASDITAAKLATLAFEAKINAIDKSQAMISFNMDGSIRTANDNFLNTLGYSLDEIQGKHHSMFVDADYKNSAEYREFWQSLNRGDPNVAEFKRFGKGGKEVWIQASYIPILDEAGKAVQVIKVASDITESKLANIAFEGKITAIDKSQAMISFNMDGTIQTANDNFLNALGYSLEEVQGNHHSMFVDSEYKNSHEYREFWQGLNRGDSNVAEFKRFGKGGREIWIQASYIPVLDDSGKPIQVIKVASDITETKLQSVDFAGKVDAISRSQAMIEFSIDGTILDANENFLATLGYSLDEIKGQHHSLFVDPNYKHSHEYKDFWAQLGQGVYQSDEFKRFGKNGKEVWIQATYNPILDSEGKVLKVVKFASDVTERKLETAEVEGKITAISKAQAVIEFDLDGVILAANDNLLATMGYSMGEIKGRHHSMFVDTLTRESAEYKQFWQSLREGELQASVFKRIAKNGQVVWLNASYNPIFDSEGRPFKVVKYATDITENQNSQNEVIKTMQALSEGDLTKRIDGQYKGVFLSLKNTVNTSLTDLKKMVVGIRESAMDISSASKDISQGNLDLSNRTEQQAASLEETASSMEELASTMKQNAENARHAEQLSSEAKEVAQSGGAVVTNAISAMNDINQASKKIADIIGVIDEIAFQTNLLALNAAVEAARAGEQGRGFAVVATEVRNLAQRSASAAKEIKVLINDSVEKVGEGSQLVNQSGKVLTEIVDSVAKVSDIISEITLASAEQSAGIDQVNSAITDMDSVTQQNAALVEEAAAASESMSDQALGMQRQIEHFNTGGDVPMARAGFDNTQNVARSQAFH